MAVVEKIALCPITGYGFVGRLLDEGRNVVATHVRGEEGRRYKSDLTGTKGGTALLWVGEKAARG